MLQILENNFRISDTMLKYITDEEMLELRNICHNISQRAKADTAKKKQGIV